ncbi:hypothetical protein FB451DRAFT_1516876 [Mycena latifolia]|nr:hypothetical protein FB451DRAFT_1516876 [Mycena latifolia]
MSMEEAEQLGFPAFELEMKYGGWSWDENVYTGIRQFHQAKGFDPDSQDVAKELGCPLVQISTEGDGPFARFEGVEDCGGDSGHHEVPHETPSEAIHKESKPQAAEPPAPEPSVVSQSLPRRPRNPQRVPASEPDVIPAPESEDYVPQMLMTDSSHPGAFPDEPEEMPGPISLPEPVPAIAEEPNRASDAPAPEPRRSASETVVGAEEHAAAVSPYPYGLQPARMSQDAPAEPVAEANVPEEERAEVPQPRQWADEGGWDSMGFMPVSEAVPAAATVAEDNQKPFADPPPGERGLPRNEDDSVFLPIAMVGHDREAEVERRDVDEGGGISSIPMPARNPHESSAALRAALTLYCGFKMRLRLVALGRAVPYLHQGLVQRVRLGVPRNAQALVTVSDASHGRDSEYTGRSDGGARARVRECVVSNVGRSFRVSQRLRIYTRPGLLEFAPAGAAVSIPRRERVRARKGRVAACDEARCVRDVPRTRAVHPVEKLLIGVRGLQVA